MQVENKTLKSSTKWNITLSLSNLFFNSKQRIGKKVITNCDNLPENVKLSPTAPLAFTEQGVAMLSGILRSKKAIGVNISIMRAFVILRQLAFSNNELSEKLKELEINYDENFKDVYEAINYLINHDKLVNEQMTRKKLGTNK